MKESCKRIAWIAVSFLAAAAPGMDWTVQRKLRPDAFEIGGYLHQAIGRTFDAIGTDRISMAILIVVVLWLTNRYLFHKPRETGVGEYLLCGLFTLMQLLNVAINQVGTVAVLWENMFQLFKVFLYLPGMFVLFLCACRALNELLRHKCTLKRSKRWDAHPFAFPFVALLLAWLPHLIIKYPGALTIDTVLQYHQYALLRPRTTPHPPFGSVVYGWLIKTALASGQMNLFYFGFTLIKTLLFIAVLSYALSVMNRRKLPMWICWLSMALFAVSPVYVGWTTVISKDSAYLIVTMLAAALMLEAMSDVKAFLSSWRHIAALIFSLSIMMLVRHNGIAIAIPLCVVLFFKLLREKAGGKMLRRLAAITFASLVLGAGTEQLIIAVMDIEKVSVDDWMAIPLQQTARIVLQHGEEVTDEEKAVISEMMSYDTIAQDYTEADSDGIRYSEHGPRTPENVSAYLKVWWDQVRRYPVTALDAMLHMNGVLFDLQDNNPVYVGLTDHFFTEHVYLHSFNDMSYYNSEVIRPLNGLQRALTEWYYRFDQLPLVGGFASMGFCMELMMFICYWAVVHRRKGMLLVLLPALVTGVSGLFCPIVYSRYLLPMMGSVPLWIAGWGISIQNDENAKDL